MCLNAAWNLQVEVVFWLLSRGTPSAATNSNVLWVEGLMQEGRWVIVYHVAAANIIHSTLRYNKILIDGCAANSVEQKASWMGLCLTHLWHCLREVIVIFYLLYYICYITIFNEENCYLNKNELHFNLYLGIQLTSIFLQGNIDILGHILLELLDHGNLHWTHTATAQYCGTWSKPSRRNIALQPMPKCNSWSSFTENVLPTLSTVDTFHPAHSSHEWSTAKENTYDVMARRKLRYAYGANTEQWCLLHRDLTCSVLLWCMSQ